MDECPWKNWALEHPDEPCWGEVEHVDDLEGVDGEWEALHACKGHARFHSLSATEYIKEPKDESQATGS